ncbi:MAG TPA: hypothetical protein PKK43_05810 [Spirochaetota bacterium]|nr:hypothetical protein [Spirochaetota bacterium]
MYSHFANPVVTKPVTGLTLSPPVTLAREGDVCTFVVQATFDDGSVADVSASAKWSVTGNITAGTQGSIIAGSSGTGEIVASYGGLTASGSITIEPSSSVFVSVSTGNDSTGTGSPKNPYKTLSYAYSVASGSIFMAAGDYNLSDQLVIKKPVKIYGGYSPSDWSRDINQNITRITDTSSSTGTSSTTASPIVLSSAGSPELNGLYINGRDSGDFTTAVDILIGTPSIVSCVLYGGAGTDTVYVLKINNANTIIDSSVISSGTSESSYVFGIFCDPSSSNTLNMYNTVLKVENGNSISTAMKINTGESTELYVYNCGLITSANSSSTTSMVLIGNINGNFCNNTIIVNNTSSVGFSNGISTSLETTSGFIFANNIVNVSGHKNTFCFFNSESFSNVECNSNLFNISDPAKAYFIDVSSSSPLYPWSTSTSFFCLFKAAAGNIRGNPEFVSNDDFHLTAASPAKGAGLNGKIKGWVYFPQSSSGPVDLDSFGRSATEAWSIGAYE